MIQQNTLTVRCKHCLLSFHLSTIWAILRTTQLHDKNHDKLPSTLKWILPNF